MKEREEREESKGRRDGGHIGAVLNGDPVFNRESVSIVGRF